jgi:hypothetical protein
MVLYKNGISVWSAALAGSFPVNASTTWIGYDENNWWWGGKIDNVRIYNYARTPAQVAYDYNRGGPVGWWKMDECQGSTIFDSSGNGNNGAWSGSGGSQTSAGTCTATGTAWGNGATGKFNSSLNFDGTDDYVSVPSNTIYNVGGDMTISSWIKTSTAALTPILSNRSGGGGRLYYGIQSGKPFVFDNPALPASFPGNITINDNIWHNIVFVRSGNTSSFYVDGVFDSSATQTGYSAVADIFRIGHDVANGTPYFPGQIDDVRIYNYALTKEQIAIVKNEGSALRFGL